MLLLLPFLPAFPVSAEEEAADSIGERVPPEYEDFLAAIPEDIREYLPEELFSADSGTLADGAGKLSDFSYLLETVLRTVGFGSGIACACSRRSRGFCFSRRSPRLCGTPCGANRLDGHSPSAPRSPFSQRFSRAAIRRFGWQRIISPRSEK